MFLAARLPAGRAFTVHGQHDPPTFKTIFLHELDILAHQGEVPLKSLASKDMEHAGAGAPLHQTANDCGASGRGMVTSNAAPLNVCAEK